MFVDVDVVVVVIGFLQVFPSRLADLNTETSVSVEILVFLIGEERAEEELELGCTGLKTNDSSGLGHS